MRYLVLIVLPTVGALTLAACSSTPTPVQKSETAVLLDFDRDIAKISIGSATAALQAGDMDESVSLYEKSLVNWPADKKAWEGLYGAYEQKGDTRGMNYSAFFGKRIVWANSLRPRIAASSFENVGLMNKQTAFEDTRIPETAKRLVAFYRQKQASKSSSEVTQLLEEESIWDKVLIYPVAVISAGVTLYYLKTKLLPKATD